MPLYLTKFSYTPETWARMIGNPEDRRKAAQEYIESVGGKLHGFWYAFGEHDGYNLWEAPDNVSMAAVALAITGGGALSSLRDDGAPDRRGDARCPAQGRDKSGTDRPARSGRAAGSHTRRPGCRSRTPVTPTAGPPRWTDSGSSETRS